MKRDYRYAYADVNTIADRHLLEFLNEVHLLRNEPMEGLIIHFLNRSMYQFGARRPFVKEEFSTQFYLLQKIGKVSETGIYNLCIDLVSISKLGHIEQYHGTAMYVFLNKTFPREKKASRRGKK